MTDTPEKRKVGRPRKAPVENARDVRARLTPKAIAALEFLKAKGMTPTIAVNQSLEAYMIYGFDAQPAPITDQSTEEDVKQVLIRNFSSSQFPLVAANLFGLFTIYRKRDSLGVGAAFDKTLEEYAKILLASTPPL